MSKIHSLPPNLIAQIAAGEVIERPVYAVKELIENALDAKADTITIHIEESGLKRIIVIDNGEGMNEEDLEICFKPHTTSKLSSEDGLHHIQTLGFRGEALSSIAAISNIIIKSKPQNASEGKSIEINAGIAGEILPIGIPPGTIVTINNLFQSTPVRKKFLKSNRTEFHFIVELLTRYSLAYPEVKFSLSHNNKKIVDLKRSSNVLERIRTLLGNNFYDMVLPLSYEESYIKMSGFVVKPQITTSLHRQYIFINKRSVTNRQIAAAVKDAYGTLLGSLTHPSFVLFIDIPYDFVDVNVHPRKEEVRFVNTQMISQAVYRAVSHTLAENNLTFQGTNWNEIKINSPKFGYTNSFAGEILKEASLPWESRNITMIIPNVRLQQLHNLYIVTQTKYGILFIDQHAAHERVLYEQFITEFKAQKKKPSYPLAKSIIFELSLSDSELLQEHLPLFAKLGFEIEHYKNNAFFFNAVPLLLKDRNNISVVTEMLKDITEDKHLNEVDKASSKMIAYLACRSAIKAGDRLTKKQCEELLDQLAQTPNNTTCPHGRPTKVEIDLQKINKLFKR